MKIVVNGEPQQVETAISLKKVIEKLGFKNKKIAVELNEEIVPMRLYDETILHENDSLEIVHAIGGG